MKSLININDLSDEILHKILSASVAFSSFYNSSIALSYLSPWARILRQKKALVLVSKRWHKMATPLLYREISLRRAGQLHALVQTLINSFLASHIKELTIDETCCIHGVKPELWLQNFKLLIHLCNTLSTFKFLSILPPDIPTEWLALPRLTHLALGSGFTIDQKEAILKQLSSTLVSLQISLYPHDEFAGRHQPEFPKLEELIIHVQSPPTDLEDEEGNLTEEWSLPSIRRLIILLPPEESPDPLQAVIESHGASLTYLGIHNGRLPNMPDIFKACPNVEHLAIDHLSPRLCDSETGSTSELEEDEPTTKNIKTLDVFAGGQTWKGSQTWKEAKGWLVNFPSVQLVRYFEGYNYENFLSPAIAAKANPIEVFKEAFSWLMPELDLRIDRLPEQLATDPIHGYDGTCVYIVHQPSQYHPRADKWGQPSILDDLESPMFVEEWEEPIEIDSDSSDGESAGPADVDSDSSMSMSETSHESDISDSCMLDVWYP